MLVPTSDNPEREAELKRLKEDPGSFGAGHQAMVEQRVEKMANDAEKAGHVEAAKQMRNNKR